MMLVMATKQMTRNIALSPKLDRFIQGKIDSGRYQSASEVVREGLRLLEEREQEQKAALSEVRRQIRVGYEQIRKGQTLDADEVLAEIQALSKQRRNANRKSR